MLSKTAKFILWLNSIPLCIIYTYTHTHTHTLSLSLSHTHTHPRLLGPFITDRNLGCFHVLAIVDNAAVNIEIHVSFQINIFVFFG